jgi:Fic family protein
MQYLDIIFASIFAILGYFIKDIHSSFKDHKRCSDQQHLQFSEEVGKLKGKVEMVQQQATNDINRIEQLTQLKLDQISKDVSELSKFLHQYINKKP